MNSTVFISLLPRTFSKIPVIPGSNLSVTGRATRHNFFTSDLKVDFKLLAFAGVEIAILPLHVVDLGLWPDELLRGPVTRNAPLHLERVLLKNGRHHVDLTVTRRTANALRYMDAVIEIRVFGKVMETFPFDWLVVAKAGSYRLKIRAVGPYLAMAIHTCLCRWHTGRSRRFDRLMAIAAIDAVVADMMFMAKLNRLLLFDITARQIR